MNTTNGYLPANWKIIRLDEILDTLETGKRPRGGVKDISEGIPSIGGEHLTAQGAFNFTNIRYIPESFYKEMNTGKIVKGDILVVKDGATTGKTSLVQEILSI